MNKNRFLDILIGLLLGIIIAFAFMLIVEKHNEPASEADREDYSYETEAQHSEENGMNSDIESDEKELESSEETKDQAMAEEAPSDQERPEFLTIADLFETCDPNWNESEGYQRAIGAFQDFIGKMRAEELESYEIPRFEPAYIDDDDIPELLFALGNHTTDGVFILKYSESRDEALNIGEFSQYGGIKYVERGNRIVSQYGNQGYFMTIVSKIDGDKAVAVGSVTEGEQQYVNDEDIECYRSIYYAGYDLPAGADGSHKDNYSIREGTGPDPVNVQDPDDSYLVTEEEYQRAFDELLGIKGDSGLLRQVKYEGIGEDTTAMYLVKIKDGGRD